MRPNFLFRGIIKIKNKRGTVNGFLSPRPRVLLPYLRITCHAWLFPGQAPCRKSLVSLPGFLSEFTDQRSDLNNLNLTPFRFLWVQTICITNGIIKNPHVMKVIVQSIVCCQEFHHPFQLCSSKFMRAQSNFYFFLKST